MKVMISGMGKAGRELVRTFSQASDIELIGGICREGSDKQGQDVGILCGGERLGALCYSVAQLRQVFKFRKPDVIVDFSSPDTTMALAELCLEYHVDIIIGTTGFTAAQLKRIRDYSSLGDIAMLYAPNITLGVNVLLVMAQLAAKYLDGYDFNITEVHYKGKKDSPSGTANVISRTMRESMLENGRDGDIPITSVRAGGTIGRHQVQAVGENDRIEIIHESFSRKAFADGALLAVRSVAGRRGWLEMTDVIGLKS